MKRFYIIFTGQVQGVGFRWTVQNLASKYSLTGSAENLYNGDVEVYLQGKESDVRSLIRDLQTNSRFIRIEDYAIKEVPVDPSERSFHVVY